MQIAIMLFEDLTALDAVGPYDVLNRIPGYEVVLVGHKVGPVRTEAGGLGLVVNATFADVPSPDVVVVPGGVGQEALMTDTVVLDWLRSVDRTSTWMTSVCTGSLALAAAGLLTGRRATTYWLALEELRALGAVPVEERFVADGKYMTAAGVSAGIDMALALTARLTDDTIAKAVQLGIEYDPQPPFDAGSPRKAQPEIVEWFRSQTRFRQAAST